MSERRIVEITAGKKKYASPWQMELTKIMATLSGIRFAHRFLSGWGSSQNSANVPKKTDSLQYRDSLGKQICLQLVLP